MSSDLLFGRLDFFGSGATLLDLSELMALRQLHQWQLWREERCATTWPALPSIMSARCMAAFRLNEGKPSMLQNDVHSVLALLASSAPKQEVRTKQQYSLDVVFGINGTNIGVEVDGPHDFLGRSRQPTGATLLKRRQLRHVGCILVSPVPPCLSDGSSDILVASWSHRCHLA